ncbi:hypothetical protein QTI66_26285 [Variovorax sp. J22R133]|uniref:hypothetical protein n=1 Tax=Variovorax brevis TaxID=3053503 RepID=UPI002578A0F7|nr:hypothetical protein [Variovorax sp. J22R133]MDM0115686.1 hypothetical protein [Variovorax sp. J22R133]
MYKPSDARPERSAKHRGARIAAMAGVALATAAAAMLLQLPLGATAGVATGGDDAVVSRAPLPPAPSPAPSASNRKAGTYQLRCWQYGRLLFDEGPVTLGAEARQQAKMVAIDRNGAPLMITADIGGTTCLARPSAPERSLALPR